MASMGQGYDLSVATFSPDGRVFQVEYAAKAIENTGLTLGAIFKDGILLAVDKYLVSSKLAVPTTSTRVFKVAPHVVCCVAGYLPDARFLIKRARSECEEYENVFGVKIPGPVLADRMGLFVHGYTAGWSTRPFGCAMIIGVLENATPDPFLASDTYLSRQPPQCTMSSMTDGPQSSPKDYSLWVIDPTGAAYRYRATALAKGSSSAKSELEKLDLNNKTCEEALVDFSKILHQAHAEVREREMKVEMIWIRAADGNVANMVPIDLLATAEQEAKDILERMEAE